MKGFFLHLVFILLVITQLPGQSFQWNDEKKPQAFPCQDPQIQVNIEPDGNCNGNNRPAVLIECRNCEGVNWNYAVEIRTEFGKWQSLHPDGLQNTAFGAAVQKVPLCSMQEGSYFVQVLAWGANCTAPVAWVVSSPVVISNSAARNVFSYSAGTPPAAASYAPEKTDQAVSPPQRTAPSQEAPQTCRIVGEARLAGLFIRGTLKLEENSPCRQLNPYAELTYKSPDLQNVTVGDIPLEPGLEIPFEIPIRNSDLNRSIHPIEVTVYPGRKITARQVPLASFWITAEAGQVAARGGAQPFAPAPTQPQITEPMLRENFDTIGVFASDPNCTQIQDLKLVYHTAQPNEPLYISWLSPRCCQESGCEYSIWIGPNPDKLRLMVKGTKPGDVIMEILQGKRSDDEYFEVVVNTSNGPRKAAYALGEGPIYGLEGVMAYRDRASKKSASDSLIYVKSGDQIQELQIRNQQRETVPYSPPVSSPGEMVASATPGYSWSGSTSSVNINTINKEPFIGEGTSSPDPGPEVMPLSEPEMPISLFGPCQYQRSTIIAGDLPAKPGEQITIKYDHSREGYRYTLYFLPERSDQWVIAPGTRELQSSPVFSLDTRIYHSGKYLILTYKPEKKWGCLSAPVTDAIQVEVKE